MDCDADEVILQLICVCMFRLSRTIAILITRSLYYSRVMKLKLTQSKQHSCFLMSDDHFDRVTTMHIIHCTTILNHDFDVCYCTTGLLRKALPAQSLQRALFVVLSSGPMS